MCFLGAKPVVPDGNFNKFQVVKKYPVVKSNVKFLHILRKETSFSLTI
jgi:hypothetical protein